MKKNILFLIFLLNVISFSAAATDTLDLSQTSGGSNNDFYYSAHSWAAQTFVPNQATLTQVSLKMKCISSAICNQSYETMDIEVRDDDGHRLGEIEDFPLSELSSSYAWETLAFDDIIETTPGETYAIYVFYNGYQLSSYPVLYWERATSDVYRAGSSSHREGSLTTTSAYDFTFKTYYDPDACLDDSDRCIDTTSWGHQNLDCDWEDVHTCGSGEVCEDAECVASVNGNIADSDIYDSGYHHTTSFESGDQIGFYIEVENTGVQDGTVAANYRVMQGSTVVVDDDYDFDIAGGDSTTNTRFYAGTETSSWSGSYTYTLSVSPCSDGNICSASGSFSVSIPVVDNDGDGYDSSSDCNDGDASVHPGASETTINGVDNDCDGLIDEDVPTTTYYEDADGDGYGNAAMAISAAICPSGYVANSSDCNDNSAAIHPGAAESVADGVDSDCDGDIDEDVPLGTYYEDADGDGYGNAAMAVSAVAQPAGYVTNATDCDDTDENNFPGAAEFCGDGVDNDCDGDVDEDCEDETEEGSCSTDGDCESGEHCVNQMCSDDVPDALLVDPEVFVTIIQTAEEEGVAIPHEEDTLAILRSLAEDILDGHGAILLTSDYITGFIDLVDLLAEEAGVSRSYLGVVVEPGGLSTKLVEMGPVPISGEIAQMIAKLDFMAEGLGFSSGTVFTLVEALDEFGKSMTYLDGIMAIYHGVTHFNCDLSLDILEEVPGETVDCTTSLVVYTAGSFLAGSVDAAVMVLDGIDAAASAVESIFIVGPKADGSGYSSLAELSDLFKAGSAALKEDIPAHCGTIGDAATCVVDAAADTADFFGEAISLIGYIFSNPFVEVTGFESGSTLNRFQVNLRNIWTNTVDKHAHVGATVMKEDGSYYCNLPYSELQLDAGETAQVEFPIPQNLEEGQEYTLVIKSWDNCREIEACPQNATDLCYEDGCCETELSEYSRTFTGTEVTDIISELTTTSPSEETSGADSSGSAEDVGPGVDTEISDDTGAEEGAAAAAAGCALSTFAKSTGTLTDVLSILLVAITGLKLRRARAH